MSNQSLNDIRTSLVAAAIMVPRSSVWRHAKGGEYAVLDHVVRESDLAVLIVYTGQDGISWARPLDDFHNRFHPVT